MTADAIKMMAPSCISRATNAMPTPGHGRDKMTLGRLRADERDEAERAGIRGDYSSPRITLS
eukprot:9020835-Pyramimonas_sp.AAC.1